MSIRRDRDGRTFGNGWALPLIIDPGQRRATRSFGKFEAAALHGFCERVERFFGIPLLMENDVFHTAEQIDVLVAPFDGGDELKRDLIDRWDFVLDLIEGREAIVESPTGAFSPFVVRETWRAMFASELVHDDLTLIS